jgi:hypothetical protein
MVSTYFFIELSPVPIPLDLIPERTLFFLAQDLSFWVAFLLLSILVFSRVKKDLELLVPSDSLEEPKKSLFLFFLVLGWGAAISLGVQDPEIAYCDGGNAFSPARSPVQLPEEPVSPPEAPPVPQPAPQPVVIPELAQPLISDETRSYVLYNRYLVLNLGGTDDLGRMVSTIDAQIIVERYVEAALVDDGFSPDSLITRYREIRGALHSPQGELLSEQTYRSYITQIRERGTRQSVPYRRIMTAIQNYNILLGRRIRRRS